MTSPGHSSDKDFLGSLGISLDIDLTADADTHASVTSIYAQTWAFEYFPYTRLELIHADLGLGQVPLAWRWYRTNLQTVRRRKSLRDLRTFFDTCTVEQVEVGAMTARLQSWIDGVVEMTMVLIEKHECYSNLLQELRSIRATVT
ncbi:hypothetical protein JCGZ_18169 [Jatropha curcas]|uniref:Aminotransferase-like plant mobile domain-containing protein n=1 Tax=Jatropha curcas TaxID=180498 RepID=A0A067K2I5_JATCU|nr:hypothetical protein JCGZ_18169 [Jatropha curcas]